ncbi:MAG: alpha-(1-_3)-arabinofuranosyltransferase family protein [Nitriliruptorales bacterium]|nr:alpha-(1->3)-arabinofuranosyltransferase family protein [Nitriliruptorales bacterium]
MNAWLRRLPAILLATAVAAAVFATEPASFTPDTQPEVYLAPGRALTEDVSAWRPSPNLGQPNLDIGLVPVELTTLGLRAMGMPPWLVTRVLRFALLSIAGLGAARLVGRLGGGLAARSTGAAVYVVNPYVVVSAATLPILQPYAFLPWLMLAILAAVRSPRSWYGPAGAALAFAAMGGQNAGVVAVFTLLAFPAVLGAAILRGGLRLREAAVITGRSAVLVIGVSLYWLVPAALAGRAGQTIAGGTESLAAIAATTSWHESLRLLGNWPLYGRSGERLFLPNAAALVTSPLVVVATFAVPVTAAFGALVGKLRFATTVGLASVAVALPVVVSAHPPGEAAPFGDAMAWAFEHVPGAIAFRTTIKAGGLVAVGLAVLIAVLADAVARWARENSAIGLLGAQLGIAVLVLATIPMWTGDLYRRAYDVPDYWFEASRWFEEEGDAGHRVWWLPGEHETVYRWGLRGPGSIANAISDRQVVSRTSVPNGSIFQTNLLAAIDSAVNTGDVPAGFLGTAARYLGAGHVLARNDTVWEESGAARPALVDRLLVADPGLRRVAEFGAPGRSTTPDGETVAPLLETERAMPPLRAYEVIEPRPTVWTGTVAGSLLVDGDGFALPAMHRAGLLQSTPPFRYLGGMSVEEVQRAVDAGARIVLTDTNRRRQFQTQRVDDNWSPVLPADAPLDDDTFAPLSLFDSDHQTVAVFDGDVVARATAWGPAFRLTAAAHPHLAIDGDPTTAWRVGGVVSPVGQRLTLDLASPRALDELTVFPVLDGTLQLSRIRVSTDAGDDVGVALPIGVDRVPVELSGTEVSRISITLTAVRGGGANTVGIREVAIPDTRADRRLRTPTTLATLGDQGLVVPPDTPIDVLLERAVVGSRVEETTFARELPMLPRRSYDGSVTARLHRTIADDVLDELFGWDGPVTATSSSRADGGSFGLRASAALDGKGDTAWIPGQGQVGEWIEVRMPPARRSSLVLDQLAQPGEAGATSISEVIVELNGVTELTSRVAPGRTTIDFAPQVVRRVRVTISDVSGPAGRVGLRELELQGASIPAPSAEDDLLGCHALLTVDGDEVGIRLEGTVRQALSGAGLRGELCEPLHVDGGTHRLRAMDGWLVDRVHLRARGLGASGSTVRPADAVRRASARVSADVTTDDRPTLVVAGEGWDPRWLGSLAGEDLGPPLLVNGSVVGWLVDSAGTHSLVATYGPQRWLVAAGLLSLAVLIVLAAAFVRLRRGREPVSPADETMLHLAPRATSVSTAHALLAPALGWLFDGAWGLAAGLAIGAVVLLVPERRHQLRTVGVVLLATLPVVVFLSGVPGRDELSPLFVFEARLAHHLAFAGVAAVLAGRSWRVRP